ncbi:MAG: hypothetical protein A4E52_02222 [Pelotomaculum sp. PtaB.Bin013]|nr:MAG: hypothetical protein A4E52_02222 [Pelotomaculum sp. PtaB.Bin013]
MKDIKVLSKEIFESAMDYLPRLLDGLSRTSQHFKENENLEGYQILHNANEGLMWFNQVVLGLPVILPQGESAIDIEKNWNNYINALNNMLSSIESRDTDAISKVLENDIVPYIKLVYEKIRSLRQGTEYTQ